MVNLARQPNARWELGLRLRHIGGVLGGPGGGSCEAGDVPPLLRVGVGRHRVEGWRSYEDAAQGEACGVTRGARERGREAARGGERRRRQTKGRVREDGERMRRMRWRIWRWCEGGCGDGAKEDLEMVRRWTRR